MLQRVYGQLKTAGLAENTIVCASSAQVELIESQLDNATEVAVEPMRRDTFPAVMLSCAYLLSKKGASPDDVVAFLPVDPYTTGAFFQCITRLGEYIRTAEQTIGLLGGGRTNGDRPTDDELRAGFLGCEDDFDQLFARKGYSSIQEVIDAQD